MEDEICKSYIDKELLSKCVKNSHYSRTPNNSNNNKPSLKTWAEGLNSHFSKENI